MHDEVLPPITTIGGHLHVGRRLNRLLKNDADLEPRP